MLKKLFCIFFGCVIAVLFIEIALGIYGWAFLSLQERRNKSATINKDAYRILCLGESTTVSGGPDAYPNQLERILNQRNTGINFSVINEGKVAANTTYILAHIEENLNKCNPDMVVTMMGINDERIKYYEDISGVDSVLFQKLKTFRLFMILLMQIKNKLDNERTGSDFPDEPCPLRARLSPDSANKYQAKKRVGFESKEAALLRSTQLNPCGDSAHVKLGKFYLENGHYLQAEKALKKAIQLCPDDAAAYSALGGCYDMQNKYPQAEEALKKAIELEQNNYLTCMQLAYVYGKQNKYPQAEDAFKTSIRLNPHNEKGYLGLGWIYAKRLEYVKAEEFMNKALAVNSRSDSAYVDLGALYGSQRKYQQSEEAFKKAIGINSNNDKAYTELGWYYLEQNKYNQAEEALQKAVELNPNNERAFFKLGDLYLLKNRLAGAEKVILKAIALNPDNASGYAALAIIRERSGQYESAQELFRKANMVRSGYRAPITQMNYLRIKKILDAKGVRLVCVQYPMRSIEPLKRIFQGERGVIFVDNERIFKEAIKRANYSDYFSDMFGGEFGHCTKKGNYLIASNIADTILKECFARRN